MGNNSFSGVVLKENFVKLKETCVTGRRRGFFLFILMNLAYIIAIAALSMVIIQQKKIISSFSCMEPIVDEYRTKDKLYGILRNKGYSLGQGLDIAEAIVKRSNELGLPLALIMAVIHQESEFYPHARSEKGAQGLMQIMPLKWDEYVAKLNLKVDRRAIADPFMNITVGCQILKDLYDGCKDIKDEKVRMAKALTDYNNGAKSKEPNRKYAVGVSQRQDEYQKKLQGYKED
jgi:soluble lytic murein transglycosylase-like protein